MSSTGLLCGGVQFI